MNLKTIDYELPKELIAKNPVFPRDSSTLVEVKESFEIYKFTYLINLLKKGDCLVINNTKVVPAELSGICKGKKISLTLNNLIRKNLKEINIEIDDDYLIVERQINSSQKSKLLINSEIRPLSDIKNTFKNDIEYQENFEQQE